MAWAGVLIVVAYTVGMAAVVLDKGARRRNIGYGAFVAREPNRVTRATPGQPYQVDDEIVAINGRMLGEKIASLEIDDIEPGDVYSATVRRDGRELTFEVRVTGPLMPVSRLSVALSVLTATLFLSCAVLIIWRRPHDEIGRWAALACGLLAVNTVAWFGQRVNGNGWNVPVPLQFMRSANSFLDWVGFCFLMRFPTPLARPRVWRAFSCASLIYCFSRAATMWSNLAVRLLPPMWSSWVWVFYVGPFGPTPVKALQLIELGGLFALMLYRLRTVRHANDRARLAWLLAPIALTAVMAIVGNFTTPGSTIDKLLPHGDLVVAPAIAYALLAKDVMGVRVVIRRTIQYILTRPLVEVALLAPVVLAVVRAVRDPTRPVGSLIGPAWLLPVAAVGIVLFPFVRGPLLGWLDRRFFRAALMEEQVVADLLDRARAATTVAELADVARRGIDAAWHPEQRALFLRQRRDGPFYDAEHDMNLSAEWQVMQRLRDGDVLRENDLAALPGASGEREWLDAGRFIRAIPVLAPGGHLSGALFVSQKKSHVPYADADDHALRSLARQIGLLHDHALLEVEQSEVLVAERTRIARELHDTLAQGFAGIGLHLDLGMRHSAPEQEQARWHMEQARQLATESLAAARRSVHDLRVMTGTGADLGEMVKAMAGQMAPKFDVHCTVTADYNGPIPLEMSQQLFRIAQESMTNIIKHSAASRVDIAMDVKAHEVSLLIRDNGRGFDVAGPRAAAYGLTGMRERAHQIRATLDVESRPEEGTTVRVVAPVPHE